MSPPRHPTFALYLYVIFPTCGALAETNDRLILYVKTKNVGVVTRKQRAADLYCMQQAQLVHQHACVVARAGIISLTSGYSPAMGRV